MYNNRILHIGNIHKLVEGLIGLVSTIKNGLMSNEGFIFRKSLNEYLEGAYDFNDFTSSGMYSFTNLKKSTNIPSNLNWGLLVVFNSGFIEQVAFGYNNVYVRMKGGTAVSMEWSEWKEL